MSKSVAFSYIICETVAYHETPFHSNKYIKFPAQGSFTKQEFNGNKNFTKNIFVILVNNFISTNWKGVNFVTPSYLIDLKCLQRNFYRYFLVFEICSRPSFILLLNTAGVMKTVPSVYTLLIKTIYQSYRTQVGVGTVFRNHSVVDSQ